MSSFLDEVRDQSKNIEILNRLFQSNKIPHAMIFTGPNGVGKFNTALQFIKTVNQNSSDEASLKKINKLSEPYIKMVIPLPRGKGENNNDSPTQKITKDQLKEINDQFEKVSENPYFRIKIPGANNIKISSIRDIKKSTNVSYDNIPYRFIVIYDAHLMNDEAQNALLKSLEEPPEGFYFILITEKKNRLLQTIHSRCWELQFSPLKNSTVTDILINKFSVSPEDAKRVSYFCEGSVLKANELLNSDFLELINDTVFILRYSLGKRYHTALDKLNKIIDNNSLDKFKLIMEFMLKWFKDAEKLRNDLDDIEFAEFKETLEKFNTKFDDIKINEVINKINKLIDASDRNINLNIITTNIIFELASLSMR